MGCWRIEMSGRLPESIRSSLHSTKATSAPPFAEKNPSADCHRSESLIQPTDMHPYDAAFGPITPIPFSDGIRLPENEAKQISVKLKRSFNEVKTEFLQS